MRVIAGCAGGIPLHTPRSDLRPTMEVVKGAIFSSLGEMVIGARVLDLFAGSGALGIEALSRGAAHVTFVESDRRAIETIERNLEKTHLTGTVKAAEVMRFLEHSASPASFDIILADPPYAKEAGDTDFAAGLLGNDPLIHALAPEGVFVLEHLPGRPLPLGDRWDCIRSRRYGATAVAILRPSAAGSGSDR